jgi:hypothetical protein
VLLNLTLVVVVQHTLVVVEVALVVQDKHLVVIPKLMVVLVYNILTSRNLVLRHKVALITRLKLRLQMDFLLVEVKVEVLAELPQEPQVEAVPVILILRIAQVEWLVYQTLVVAVPVVMQRHKDQVMVDQV